MNPVFNADLISKYNGNSPVGVWNESDDDQLMKAVQESGRTIDDPLIWSVISSTYFNGQDIQGRKRAFHAYMQCMERFHELKGNPKYKSIISHLINNNQIKRGGSSKDQKANNRKRKTENLSSPFVSPEAKERKVVHFSPPSREQNSVDLTFPSQSHSNLHAVQKQPFATQNQNKTEAHESSSVSYPNEPLKIWTVEEDKALINGIRKYYPHSLHSQTFFFDVIALKYFNGREGNTLRSSKACLGRYIHQYKDRYSFEDIFALKGEIFISDTFEISTKEIKTVSFPLPSQNELGALPSQSSQAKTQNNASAVNTLAEILAETQVNILKKTLVQAPLHIPKASVIPPIDNRVKTPSIPANRRVADERAQVSLIPKDMFLYDDKEIDDLFQKCIEEEKKNNHPSSASSSATSSSRGLIVKPVTGMRLTTGTKKLGSKSWSMEEQYVLINAIRDCDFPLSPAPEFWQFIADNYFNGKNGSTYRNAGACKNRYHAIYFRYSLKDIRNMQGDIEISFEGRRGVIKTRDNG